MENISHFLSFVSRPPVSLAAHDVFLTVDLFEQKDPAQVVQCLGAFSRVANKLDPISFPTTLGGLKVPASGGALSPQLSGGWSPGKRNVSGGSNGGGVANAYVQSAAATGAPTPFGKPSVPPRKPAVSSWSKPTDERGTVPAWNIAQYGYMGGASQGNQGVSFGARRQITNQPVVKGSSLEDREKLRKNSTDDARRMQAETQEKKRIEDEKRRIEDEKRRIEDEKRRIDEEQRRIEEEERRIAVLEAKKRREQEEKTALEIERRKWKEEDRKRRWQHEEDHHRELEHVREREQKLAEQKLAERREEEARRVRDAEAQRKLDAEKSERERERERIRQLEHELEKARERERIYEIEKEERRQQDTERMRRDAQEVLVRKHKTGDSAYGHRTSERDSFYLRSHKTGDRERENVEAERHFLAGGWRGDLATPPSTTNSTPLFPQHTPGPLSMLPPRALPTPPPRKLPPAPTTPNRVGALPSSRYFAQEHLASEPMDRSDSWETNDDGAAAALERERVEKREAEKKQAYKWARCVMTLIPEPPNPLIPTAEEVAGWITDRESWMNSMSLLERERERERERQREWEANQKEMEDRRNRGDAADDDGPAWDINQYGYADDILDLY